MWNFTSYSWTTIDAHIRDDPDGCGHISHVYFDSPLYAWDMHIRTYIYEGIKLNVQSIIPILDNSGGQDQDPWISGECQVAVVLNERSLEVDNGEGYPHPARNVLSRDDSVWLSSWKMPAGVGFTLILCQEATVVAFWITNAR